MRIVLISTIPMSSVFFYLPLAKELRKDGHEVIFCFADGTEASVISSEGFQVEILGMRRNPFSLGNFASVVKLAIFLKRNDVRVIGTSTAVASFVGRLAAVIAGVPVRINTVGGMFPMETHKWQSLLFDFAELFLHRITSYTITYNEKDKKELLTKGFAKQDKITNIGCGFLGVNLKEFDPTRRDQTTLREIKKKLGMQENDFVVTFIGRLTEEKGILDYVEVVTELLKKNHDVRGLIVGDVPIGEHKAITRAKLENILRDKRIYNKVLITGHRDDVPEIIAISDVVVLPSKREGFGMVLAEAAAMEKPVVAYRSRGVEEAVINGKTGFVVEPGDVLGFTKAIQCLHDDSNIAREIGQAARKEAVERFDQEKILKSYLEIYEKPIR